MCAWDRQNSYRKKSDLVPNTCASHQQCERAIPELLKRERWPPSLTWRPETGERPLRDLRRPRQPRHRRTENPEKRWVPDWAVKKRGKSASLKTFRLAYVAPDFFPTQKSKMVPKSDSSPRKVRQNEERCREKVSDSPKFLPELETWLCNARGFSRP
jgi:hypothetical protein